MRIVPQARLLLWVGIVFVPCSLAATVGETGMLVSAVLIGLLLVTVLVDALRGLGALEGISLELPEVTRFSKDRGGVLPIKVRNKRQGARQLRVGFAWAEELGSTKESEMVLLPAGVEWSVMSWPLRPGERGKFLVDRAYLEATSPFGFWAVRGSVPATGEVRVYPNLLTERGQMAAMFLRRGRFGAHAQRQVGKGRDFEKLRDYAPGDPIDEIHWKATAKRQHPVTKVFQIERTQEVYVVVDNSRLSGRVVEERESALERYATAALVVGLAAEQQGDLFGLMTFSDRVGGFVRAKNGRAHFNACRDALYRLQPEEVTPDFEEAAAFIRLRLRKRALVIFLTALDDPVLAESFVRSMDLLCRQHLVIAGMLKSESTNPLFSDGGVHTVDDVYERLGGHLQWNRLRELERVLGRRGVRLQLLDREELSAQLVSNYVSVKQRQLL